MVVFDACVSDGTQYNNYELWWSLCTCRGIPTGMCVCVLCVCACVCVYETIHVCGLTPLGDRPESTHDSGDRDSDSKSSRSSKTQGSTSKRQSRDEKAHSQTNRDSGRDREQSRGKGSRHSKSQPVSDTDHDEKAVTEDSTEMAQPASPAATTQAPLLNAQTERKSSKSSRTAHTAGTSHDHVNESEIELQEQTVTVDAQVVVSAGDDG